MGNTFPGKMIGCWIIFYFVSEALRDSGIKNPDMTHIMTSALFLIKLNNDIWRQGK